MDKLYVKVQCAHLPDGTIRPESMEWMDGQVWEITRVLHAAAPADHEFEGIRYTVLIGSAEKYIYRTGNRWYDYVVPPLEGFWWQEGVKGVDYAHKDAFHWISVIRLPDFVTKEDFDWAIEEATQKKKTDFSKVEFFHYDEGLCVQCMHIGAYDDEPATVELMHQYMADQGYELDITEARMHHEIYLSDARKVAPEKLKTVIRHPVRKMEQP